VQLENDLRALENEKLIIQQMFLQPDMDNEKIQELSIKIGKIKKEIDVMEARWLELSDKN